MRSTFLQYPRPNLPKVFFALCHSLCFAHQTAAFAFQKEARPWVSRTGQEWRLPPVRFETVHFSVSEVGSLSTSASWLLSTIAYCETVVFPKRCNREVTDGPKRCNREVTDYPKRCNREIIDGIWEVWKFYLVDNTFGSMNGLGLFLLCTTFASFSSIGGDTVAFTTRIFEI